METTIIYIAGYGRSGSTILDIVLSNSDNVITIGEISNVFRELNNTTNKYYADILATTVKELSLSKEEINNIKDADKKGIYAIAADLGELSGKARDGKLGPGDMQGGTFSISSLGGLGGTAFTPIVNAPEVAILGVSKSSMKPVWDGSEFVPRLMLPLSLSYDHRVIDGAAAARFTTYLAGVLADLRRLIL